MIVLHWQVPKWLSGTSLVTRVIICSSVLHLCALIAIFVVYQGTSQFHITISGNMINPNSEIVFMPLHRSIKQTAGGVKSGSGASSKASVKSSTAQVEKAIDAGGTTLVKLRSLPSTSSGRADKKKAQQKKIELKKALDVKNEKIKKEVAAKKDKPARTEPVEVNERSKDSTSDPKVEPAQTQSTKQETFAGNANLNSDSSASSIATDGAIEGVVYVGQAEMDALQAQEYIQQELAQHWAPPSGMRSDLFAIVTLTIDFEGAIKKVDLTTSSGNLLFDTAAKKAAALITPARWTFGKELSITFKP